MAPKVSAAAKKSANKPNTGKRRSGKTQPKQAPKRRSKRQIKAKIILPDYTALEYARMVDLVRYHSGDEIIACFDYHQRWPNNRPPTAGTMRKVHDHYEKYDNCLTPEHGSEFHPSKTDAAKSGTSAATTSATTSEKSSSRSSSESSSTANLTNNNNNNNDNDATIVKVALTK